MSNLKKEFQKKDVERLRNLVKGKYGNKSTVGIGYTKKEEFHKVTSNLSDDIKTKFQHTTITDETVIADKNSATSVACPLS